MAAPYNPPKKNEDFIIYIMLEDASAPGSFKVNPTIAAGDAQVQLDGGTLNNLATLPAVTPSGSRWVKVTLSSGEMNGDDICFQMIDQTNPKEWNDFSLCIPTTQ